MPAATGINLPNFSIKNLAMRIILTGSSGLIGSQLKTTLRAEGHEVIVLVRSHPTAASERFWKPSDFTLEQDALEGADAVIHLAGAGIADERWSASRKRVLYRSRIDSTRLLVERMATLEKKPQVFVCASAIGYYGDRGDELLTEDSARGDGFLADLCADWEAEARKAEDLGVRTVRMRTGVVLDAQGGALGQMLLPFKLGVGGKLGNGKQYMSWVSSDDVVAAYKLAVENVDIAGAINLTAPTPVTNREFTKTLGEVLGRPTILPVPRFGVRVLFGEMGETLLLEGSRVIPEALLEHGYEFRYTDLQACLHNELDATG